MIYFATLIRFLKKHSIALFLLIAGLYLQVFQISGFNLQRIAGDLGDTRFIMAIVEFNFQWLSGNYKDYWDGFFMYPDQEVISYSDNVLGSLPLYALFRFSGADYLYTFQLLVLVSHAMNFFAAYFCFLKMGAQPLSAALGAFIFSFDLALSFLHNHPQFSFRYAIPFCFLFLHTYLQGAQKKHLLYALLALVFQFYLGVYLGYFLFLAAVVYTISYNLIHNRQWQKLKVQVIDLLKTGPVALLLIGPLIYYYIKRGLITGYYNDYNYYMQTVPRPGSYFKAFDGSTTWEFLRKTDVYSDFSWQHPLFPGALVLLSLIFSIWLSFRGNRQFLILSISLFLIISFTTYYEGHTLYGYLMKIPGIKAIRVVSRLICLLVFFAGWLLCLQSDLLLKTKPWLKTALYLLLPLLLVVDNLSNSSHYKSFSMEECRTRVDRLAQKVNERAPVDRDKILVFLQKDSGNVDFHQLDAMLCALQFGLRTVNGYSSSCHRYYGPFWRKPDLVSLRMWSREMRIDPLQLLVLD